jgi:hypothetical protein
VSSGKSKGAGAVGMYSYPPTYPAPTPSSQPASRPVSANNRLSSKKDSIPGSSTGAGTIGTGTSTGTGTTYNASGVGVRTMREFSSGFYQPAEAGTSFQRGCFCAVDTVRENLCGMRSKPYLLRIVRRASD